MTEKGTYKGKTIILVPAPEPPRCNGCIAATLQGVCGILPGCIMPDKDFEVGVWIYEESSTD